MAFLGFITPMIAGVLLIIGILGLVFKNKLAIAIAKANPLFPAQTTLMVIIVLAFIGGGIAGIGAIWSSITTAVITAPVVPEAVEGVSAYGTITVTMHDGLSNATTTEDYLNDEKNFMTIYSADANIEDGEEYLFNVTIERSAIAEDANVKVTCNIADKEISGVTFTNLAEKTSGQVDLDINDGGIYFDDNTVWKYIAFSEGVNSQEVQVAFDQEETYHDGMTDMDDYVDLVCDAEGVPFTLRVYADS